MELDRDALWKKYSVGSSRVGPHLCREEFNSLLDDIEQQTGKLVSWIIVRAYGESSTTGRITAAPSEETMKLARAAVESQKNDTRTIEQKIADGVEFICGSDKPSWASGSPNVSES